MVSEGLGFLIVLPMLEDVTQSTDVDRHETRFLTDSEVSNPPTDLKTHVEEPGVTEGCTIFRNPLFMGQCVFWVESEIEIP